MRLTHLAVLTLASLATPALAEGPTPKVAATASSSEAKYLAAGRDLARSIATIARPLKSLTKEQRASVAALLVITRVVSGSPSAKGSAQAAVLEAVWDETQDVCPPIKSAPFSRGGCLDANVAYATSMAKCLADKKSEATCEKLASPELSVAVACEMKRLGELPGVIGLLPGRDWPPGPFPWPETGGAPPPVP